MTDNASAVALFDLHLHSFWSYDATAQPEFYLRCARELGVRCIAVTDHHVLDSMDAVRIAASRCPEVRVVPAAELTVTTSAGSTDLLCYGFSERRTRALDEILALYHDWQRAAGDALSRGMRALGYTFTDADRLRLLESYRPPEVVRVQGNTHVMNARLREYFVQRGFLAGPEDYADLMRRMRERIPFPPYPAVDRVVTAVQGAGAVVAVAHPFRYFDGYDLRKMDVLREECGLDGIECAHPTVPSEFTVRYRGYCEEHNLFSVGGSDCHHDDLAARTLGRHGGAPQWLDEFLDRVESKGIRGP